VNALKGPEGWELDIEGEGLATGGGITHTGSLDDAVHAVRDHLQSTYGVDFSDAIIEIVSPHGDDHLDSPHVSG
jgi:hypothetical protein